MFFENKLDISDSLELAKIEEKLSKKKAIQLFDRGYLDGLYAGTFASLAKIHQFLFDEIYDFAGQIRDVNMVKGNFRFAPVLYLKRL